MKKQALFWQLFGSQLVILFLAIGVVLVYTWISYQQAFRTKWLLDLEEQARVMGVMVFKQEQLLPLEDIHNLFVRVAEASGSRFTLMTLEGKVLADTEADSRHMDSHANRPEVRDAIQLGRGVSKRHSFTVDRQMIYLALRIPIQGEAKAILRVAVAEHRFLFGLEEQDEMLLLISAVVILVALAMSYLAARRIIRPVETIQKGVERLGAGELSCRLEIPRVPHLAALAHSINQMAEQIEKLTTIRQDFVGNVSHELRTPITSIKGFAETLLEGAKDSPAFRDRFLKIIVRQATQLESIIRDLLSLSRMEQNQTMNVVREQVDVEKLLRRVVMTCQERFGEKEIQFHLTCEKGIVASWHPGLIEQALVNLIDNAAKYGVTPEKPYVDVAVQLCPSQRITQEHSTIPESVARHDVVKIQIRDYGTGIEEKHLERIFERFYRVDKGRSREMGGTGLGLAIVKHIALIHGGQISVESTSGKGTTFTLLLPLGTR